MRKKVTRWYEKNEHLKAFMTLLKDLAFDVQCEIAVDMILKSSSVGERDYTNIIADVAHFNPRSFHRWYDKNPNVHVAIESLKDLTEKQCEEVISPLLDKILNSHYIKIDENGEVAL